MSLIWFDAIDGKRVVINSDHAALVRDADKPGIVQLWLVGDDEPVLLRDSIEGVYSTVIAHEKKT